MLVMSSLPTAPAKREKANPVSKVAVLQNVSKVEIQ
jgi:hypothetical protein